MRIVEINQKEELNNFIVQYGGSNFLQSWEWGELQKNLGRDIWRVGIEEAGKLVFSALIIKNRLPLGRSYLYCPRGPVFENSKFKIQNLKLVGWKLLSEKIREVAQKERAVFFRFDYPDLHLPEFLKGKVVQSPKDIQPRSTLIWDITGSEEEILAQMKPKTRYNIRLAQRKGVRVRQGVEQTDLNIFLSLIKETSQRDGFKIHPEFYYQKMVDFLGKEGILKIFLAELQEKVLAANLVLFWGERATYLHGASGNANRNVMAPHLLQWEQIREAKRFGCREYDFWGIMSELGIRNQELGIKTNDEQSSWVGITRFKKGFGGREVNYAGTYDFALNHSWYKIYRLFK
ncbi:MAG: peptidoglycan bridge formation glycyltransferase FemA/FemB family protein [Patescibacteria group bacterium]|nr:peptidoglycan bridge formation glycyltransferase FemA/FemB family protein [Patescibacteria group bacterium]